MALRRHGRRCLPPAVLIFLAAGAPLYARTQTPLDWNACVKETGENNPDLKSADYNLRAAEFQRKAAFSGYLPQVSGNASALRGNAANLPAGTGSAPEIGGGGTVKTRTSASVGLTQNLFAGFQTEGTVAQAGANRDASSAALDIMKAQVSADLRGAFAGLKYSQEYLELARAIIQRRQENFELVELRYQSGNENQGSHLLSHAALSDARFNELQAGDSIRVSRQQLARVLGRIASDEIRITGSVFLPDPPAAPDFEGLMQAAPEERQALAQKLAADAGLKIAKSQFYPSIDLSGELGREDVHEGRGGRNRWQTGVSLNLPLFAGGQNYYNAKTALQNVLAAGAERESIDRLLLVNLKQTHTSFVEAAARVKVDREYVTAASVRAEIARAKYNNGLLSFEDWDIIENDLINRQKALLLSEHDRVIAGAAWEQAQGRGVFP